MTSRLHTDSRHRHALCASLWRTLHGRLARIRRGAWSAQRLYRLLHAAIVRACIDLHPVGDDADAAWLRRAVALLEEVALTPSRDTNRDAVYNDLDRDDTGNMHWAANAVRSGLVARRCGVRGQFYTIWHYLVELAVEDGHGSRDRPFEIIADLVPDTLPAFSPHLLAWQGGTVRNLARGVVASRDFAALPVLGDALEDAGCADAAILEHCRGPGPHYLGCHVLEAILAPAV